MTTFIARSRLGKAMRATAQDPEAARLMGINVDTTISLTFLIGGMLAGAAGLIYALYQTTIWYFQGFTAGLIAFTAAVMGGIGNIRGAVLGGLIIGFIQQISDNRIGRGVDPGDRVRLPDPDHGLQAVRPAGRGDEGGRMSAAAATAPERPLRAAASAASPSPPWAEKAVGAGPVLVIAILLPFLFDPGSAFIDDCVLALAYVVMALGLNIIVGFAGLLDLGYVAFFAIGAYTMGWFGSGFFACVNHADGHPHRRQRVRGEPARHPPQLRARARRRGALHDDRRHHHRPADAAPARRLHRDRDARLRRDHRPHRRQRRRHQARQGPAPRRPAEERLRHRTRRSPPAARASRRWTRSTCHSLDPFTSLEPRPWYYVALVLVLIVLFVNFRLRDSRLGRAWIALREDEVAAVAMGVPSVKTKLLAYGTGAAFGGISGAFLGSYLTRSTPTSSSSPSRSSSSAWSSSAGSARSGAWCSARSSLSFINY